MAEIQPLRALHYNLEKTGGLQRVIAPPYDVIDPAQRAELAARSPYNVVRIDLPRGDGDPYEQAAAELRSWRRRGAVVRDPQPALWPVSQQYSGPDGATRVRHGFLARVRVVSYGPGQIRPHERTHPGPKEDRLRLTRATQANLSPIFALFSDDTAAVRGVLRQATASDPWAEAVDDDGTRNGLWRLTDRDAIATVAASLAPAELLIADGHHRYETARVYAEEVGGEGPHRYVLMCLVALEDPGLTVFPTHRLVRGLTPRQHEDLAQAIRRDFDIAELPAPEALPPAPGERLSIGYIDAHFRRPFMLTLKDPAIAVRALDGRSDAYRHLDTAVLEALILKGALGMSDEDIDHLAGLGYARTVEEALADLGPDRFDAAFFMAPTPVTRVQSVAAAGESMPPKSTYFFPKVPTGLLFNPLTEAEDLQR